MDLQLPADLHATRDLLMRSLATHHEQAPPMPVGLASDLSAHFAPRVMKTVVTAPLSWSEKVRAFLSTPAFGAVAAAVVVLGIAAPMLSKPSTETFRGDLPVAQAPAVRIIFTGSAPEIRAAVETSGTFDSTALFSMDSQVAAIQPGPKVIVNLTTSTITAIDRDGATLHRASIPTEPARVADAIALAVQSL